MAKPIFIYDDPQKSLSALSEYLRANGYDPIDVAAEQITADSDIAAQFKGHQPELIFVSLLLPESIEITNQIRNVPEGTVTPIIFIGTGNESVSSPSEALYHGGDYFFALPLDLPTVLARVQVYIGTGLSGNLPELPPISPSTELPPPPAELPPAPDPAPAPIAPIHHPAQTKQPNSPQLPQFNWKNKEQGIQTGEQNLTDAADDILALISAREDKNKEQEQQKEAEEEKKRQDEAEAEARKLAEEAMAQETLAKEKEKLAAERKLAEAERTRLEVEALSQRIAQEKEEKVEQEERARRDAEELARQIEEEKVQEEEKEKAKRDAEELARQIEEEKVQEEEKEKARRDAEELARQIEEEKTQKEEKEKARRDAEELARQIEEEKEEQEKEEKERARKDAEELARQIEEEKTQKEEQERARRDAEELARQIEEEKAQKERDDGQRRAEEAYQLIEQAAQQAKEAEAQEKINALQKEAEEARMLADKAEQARQEEKEELKRRLETFKEENDKLLKNQLDESKREAEEKETLLRQQLESEMRERLEKEQREAEEKEKRERLEKEKKETEERDFRKRIEDETRARLDAEYRQREEAAQAISLQKINTENSEAQIEREIRERIESELRSQYGLLPADTAIEPRAPEFPTKPQVYPSQTTAPSPIEQQRPTATEFERPPLQAPEKPFGEFGQNEDIAIVFVRQWQAQTTGRVDFESDGHRKSVFFERGAPVDARSSQLFDRIEEYLFREGKISRAAYQDVRVKGLRGPRKIGSYLVRQGHLKAGELFTAIRGHLQQIIFGIFEWETGHYVWSGEHVEEDDRVALDKDPRALLTEAIRRKYSLTRMIDRLGPPSTLMGDGDPKNPVDLDAMLLLPGEKRITRLVDGTRNIEDLVFTSGAEAEEVYRTLIMLEAFGFIKIIVRGQEEQSENGRSASDEIDRERIREKVEQARHSDYFCVLGLNRNATPYEIDQAAKSMRQEFASSRYSTTVAEDLAPMIDEIQRVLDDAWQILREPGMRDSYASHLPVE